MNPRILALNKLEAAYDLIRDATHELAGYPCDETHEMGYVASLTWLGGDLATVIRELEKEDERMGIIWSCDRCGKMCDARENNQGWRIGKDALDMGMRIDLCPDCVEGLRAYLRGEDL